VSQKIIDRLYYRPFPQQYFVSDIHQLVFHILPQPGDQLNSGEEGYRKNSPGSNERVTGLGADKGQRVLKKIPKTP